ncbi:hypothetical protein CEP51_016148 [Fusarium floridanum]|uniref:Uncharacterized protein n=1 Tax=Fusarium floridanum TaxID=1325733 RepID=A0A428NWC6_9HYPO|nr:hypothetical protein CEP51_016148 [Fusarium floridanum]
MHSPPAKRKFPNQHFTISHRPLNDAESKNLEYAFPSRKAASFPTNTSSLAIALSTTQRPRTPSPSQRRGAKNAIAFSTTRSQERHRPLNDAEAKNAIALSTTRRLRMPSPSQRRGAKNAIALSTTRSQERHRPLNDAEAKNAIALSTTRS